MISNVLLEPLFFVFQFLQWPENSRKLFPFKRSFFLLNARSWCPENIRYLSSPGTHVMSCHVIKLHRLIKLISPRLPFSLDITIFRSLSALKSFGWFWHDLFFRKCLQARVLNHMIETLTSPMIFLSNGRKLKTSHVKIFYTNKEYSHINKKERTHAMLFFLPWNKAGCTA